MSRRGSCAAWTWRDPSRAFGGHLARLVQMHPGYGPGIEERLRPGLCLRTVYGSYPLRSGITRRRSSRFRYALADHALRYARSEVPAPFDDSAAVAPYLQVQACWREHLLDRESSLRASRSTPAKAGD